LIHFEDDLIMRLATLDTPYGPRACARAADRYVDLHAADPGLPASLRQILALGTEALARAARAAARPQPDITYPAESAVFLPPIPDPQKIICLGLNYKDHAAESGMPVPEEPVLFSKFPSALIGHRAAIELPPESQQVDYEAELVAVIGKRARRIPQEHALACVAGYAIGHDVSARDWQLHKPGKQWLAGKTFDTFAPLGPELVTADEVKNPHNLRIQLRLNGHTMQDSSTAQLIFPVDFVVAYLSRIMTLEPGDLIFTGTPPGVGMARKPPVYLQNGDQVEVEIESLGTLENAVHAPL
jgi:2-keto-4-pentenoate hydratase/2-oxohepta-3-ene-1,7-dioic acid hydratase in catechol pathway